MCERERDIERENSRGRDRTCAKPWQFMHFHRSNTFPASKRERVSTPRCTGVCERKRRGGGEGERDIKRESVCVREREREGERESERAREIEGEK